MLTEIEYRNFKGIMNRLAMEWSQWSHIRSRNPYVGRLVYTEGLDFRRDMKTTQKVGKVKFKFQYGRGSFWGQSSTNLRDKPRFCVSTLPKPKSEDTRISWMVFSDNTPVHLAVRRGKVWTDFIRMEDFFEDISKPTVAEVDFFNALFPGVVVELPKLHEGLNGITQKLKERFSG